jgi:hypothetical protein
MPHRTFTFTFASGATGTNKQYIGPSSRVFLVASAMTNYNAAAGNATITLRGGLSASDTHADMTSMSIATHTIKGYYPMPYAGAEYMSIGFATAVTGGAANTIDLVVFHER